VAFQRKKPADIGVKAPFPGFIEPALASSIEKVPGGERWLHEIRCRRSKIRMVYAWNATSCEVQAADCCSITHQ
jgi:hypothetical protein